MCTFVFSFFYAEDIDRTGEGGMGGCTEHHGQTDRRRKQANKQTNKQSLQPARSWSCSGRGREYSSVGVSCVSCQGRWFHFLVSVFRFFISLFLFNRRQWARVAESRRSSKRALKHGERLEGLKAAASSTSQLSMGGGLQLLILPSCTIQGFRAESCKSSRAPADLSGGCKTKWPSQSGKKKSHFF